MRYIDADKLIEEINERIKAAIEWGKSAETEEIKIRAEQAIATFCEASLTAKKLSTADVRENVRGEWIDDGIHGDWAWETDEHGVSWQIWKCSRCGRGTKIRSNYCPNCGAQMERK